MLKSVSQILNDKLAEDIKILDLRGLTSVTDYFLIATGNSQPHLNSLVEGLELELKDLGERVYKKAGGPESEWIVMDFVDIVVHIMTQEMREFYALEQLWSEAAPVENTDG